jgi:hypothetical protein
MKTKLKTLFSLLCGTMLGLTLHAAGETTSPPHGNCSYWYACEAIQKSYFEYSEGTDLSQLEFGDLMYGKTQILHEQIEKCYHPASGLTVTRTLLNPDEALNPWMKRVHQSVITKQGVQMFDDALNEIGNYPSSPKQLEFWQEMESEIAHSGFEPEVNFEFPGADEITSLQASGVQFFEYPDGRFSFTDATTEMIIDPENLQIETNELVEGELMFTTIEGFTEGGEGTYLTSFKIEKAYQTLPSGTCGAFVTITNYSNVSTTPSSLGKNSLNSGSFELSDFQEVTAASDIGTFEVFPNPTSGKVSVYLSNLQSSDGVFNLKIIDMSGRTVLSSSISNKNLINLDMQSVPDGMYLIHISSDMQSMTKKLMKN